VGSKIDSIKTRISDLTRSLQIYGVNAIIQEGLNSAFDRQRQLRWSYSHIVEEYIVGLDEDIEEVVVHLINEDKHCQVVSICGMSGLGKTTLAKKVYHHSDIRRHFLRFRLGLYILAMQDKRCLGWNFSQAYLSNQG
jgi:pantothenate kinase-related protein Tda10